MNRPRLPYFAAARLAGEPLWRAVAYWPVVMALEVVLREQPLVGVH